MKRLIIVGPGRTATTSIFDSLSKDSKVSPSEVKELHYYSRGVSAYRGMNHEVKQSYDENFCIDNETQVLLEATPSYFMLSDILPNKINDKDTYVMCVLREPKDRYVSLYNHVKNKVIFNDGYTLKDYLDKSIKVTLDDIESIEEAIHYSGYYESDYAKHLLNYIEAFGKDKVIVLDYNKLNDLDYISNKLLVMNVGHVECKVGYTNQSSDYRSIIMQKYAQKIYETFEWYLNKHQKIKLFGKSLYFLINRRTVSNSSGKVNDNELDLSLRNKELKDVLKKFDYEIPEWLDK
ncbi:sulfotransferase domain-containing protein [Vibrio pomeroyi]|uniref:sulfotransferase domain-containing protein n=1 Tax=Vibrio pomeroyi TaxID=198832 RepID=UPI0021C3343B|nr:sulfotransferase domain-containing protein [Vibrio pomeroyi]